MRVPIAAQLGLLVLLTTLLGIGVLAIVTVSSSAPFPPHPSSLMRRGAVRSIGDKYRANSGIDLVDNYPWFCRGCRVGVW